MSIRLRLTLWYTGILAVTLVTLGFAIYFALSTSLMGDLKEKVKDQGDQVAAEVRPVLTRRGVSLSLPPLDTFQTGMVMQLIYPTGEPISQSGNLAVALPLGKQTLDLAPKSQWFYETIDFGQSSVIVYNYSLFFQNELQVILRVASSTDYIDNTLRQLKFTLFLVGLFVILLAASVGWFLARKALRPIEGVIEAANRIEKSADLDRRIDYIGPSDEVGRLTDTINGMLARIQIMYTELDEAYRAQRRFVSDASHELRTPLTTIRGNVDLLEKVWRSASNPDAAGIDGENVQMSLEAMRDISDEAERMSRMVNDLLSLARADAGQTIHKGPVEIKPLVEEVIRRAQFLPRTADWIPGNPEVLNGIVVQGNKDYLQQLLFIFIENGFKYTDEGSVRLDFIRGDGQIGFRVSDTGIGMDKEEVPHIFERFYRADPSRGTKSGTGLGLSIAKWIIDEHGGSIEVMTQKGLGTTFVIWLPTTRSLPSS
ncbi:sensor histidine kinase [Paenibacillus sp. HJGM_3]|uniref:sensor histidine kinase n=1 Tax=Paenibacillus sp. HJGM_3 TaxID=3379816 RepID=UPI00385BBB57